MTRRNKLLKFTENLTFPNVYESHMYGNPQLKGENGELVNLGGRWAEGHFNNSNPITLELACGRGEYCLALARKYPSKNFIGVDIKGARIWKGAKIALEEGLTNVAFLRTKIEAIDLFFGKNEVSEIWITFPDPFLKESKYNRRLTSPNFLSLYRTILGSEGLINLKTDSTELYEHTLEVLNEKKHNILINKKDIYTGPLPHPDLDVKTYYEKKHLKEGRKIKYLQFQI